MPFNRILRRSAVAAAALLLTTATVHPPAGADTTTVAQSTVVGVHNTYNRADFSYLAQALDAGTSMIELDAWDDFFTHEWKVSHSNPTGNDNNCVNASSPSDLYTGSANKDLESCLDDIRVWLGAHPANGPIFIKVELKAGFQNTYGMGPSAFDAAVSAHLGDRLFRPADLLGDHATLDDAATANAWPSRSALAGKAIVYIIPGTVELSNPSDTLHTDVEYATYLKNLKAAGKIGTATAFPAVLGALAGDPRAQYTDASIRPWFVVFDGDAATYVSGIDTSWYDTNHYLLTMTDAHLVPPALDDTNPPVSDAEDRVALLAHDHATVVSCDWYGLPTVLSEVLPRG
jgi:Phosphoinositide phospholipase C, Ca2+-dependent